MKPHRSLVWLAGLCLVGLAVGCTRTTPTPPATPPPMPTPMLTPPATFDTESGPHAAGKKVFVANGCFRCHAINGVRGPVGTMPGQPGMPPMPGGGPVAGEPPGPGGPPMPGMPPGPPGPGGKMGPRAPDLGKVGADPTHTVEWLMNYIRAPKSVKENARMPAFKDKIKEDDLRALAEYLASLN